MPKVYSQKENINIYIALLVLFVVVYIWGVWLVNYHLFVLLAPAALMVMKIINIRKNPEVPVVKLTDTEVQLLLTGKSYMYSEISHFHMDSKFFNGYVILKESTKKQFINSVAISKDDQKEIREFVLSRIG